MGKIIASEFVSVDGVYESPSWTMEFGFDPKMGEAMSTFMGPLTSDILLGRITHAEFAPAWSTRSGDDDPGAPFMNETPKHVVSSTGPDVEWSNTMPIGPYDPVAIADLKARASGNIWTSGSGTLVRSLIADQLLGELHLFVYPVVRGFGKRLFRSSEAPQNLRLFDCDASGNGVVHLAYQLS